MQLDFFPSRTVTFYLSRLFITRVLAVLVMLVLVLQTLDLLSESGSIMEYPGNGQAELWRYVSLRLPQLVSRFLPYSVLLATIITLATLNQNSEVIAMKAAGMSAHQVLAPLLLTAMAVSVVNFAFNERVVTRANATLKTWEKNDYGPLPRNSGTRNNVYLRDGPNVLAAASLSHTPEGRLMEGVTWYRRDASGIILEKIQSPRATYANPGWKLENPVSFDVQTTSLRPLRPFVVGKELTLARVDTTGVEADNKSIVELSHAIRLMEATGRQTGELRAAWWHKISGPLSSVLMPLLGAVAAFGLARSGQLFVRSVAGMALGFAYFVVDNAALAMGSFGGYPPFLAAWAPFFLFALLGEAVLIRTEE
ncbi:MAG: LPS export ABC transporter permease LptG [Novosphingobium sp.]|jgi:lipopolysaccharide export system permease protein